MAHLRNRHILPELIKLSKFWSIVGVLGLRQTGKSTVLRDLLGVENYCTLDDEETLADLRMSAKNFLDKVGRPVIIDEAPKVPKLFDALKLNVDKKKRPGSYFLTGSSEFSAKIGIRESLTGRIGLIHLYPFTLAEAHQLEFSKERVQPLHQTSARFPVRMALERLSAGGLPVPLFTRDKENRRRYLRAWLETAVLRDAARVFGAGYDPDVSWSILRQMGEHLRNGECSSLSDFKQSSRILRKYLSAFEEIFVLRKIPCHEEGVGKEIWLPTDGGLATEIMTTEIGEGTTLSLGRIFVYNEILARSEYLGEPIRPVYYKTARGAPIDLIWKDCLIKVSHRPTSQLAYDERPLAAALKKLKLKSGILAIPSDRTSIEAKGISVVPWTHWS